MDILSLITYDTVFHSIPIILCVIGGAFAYKANVLNIALEGFMLNGAFVFTFFVYKTNNIFLATLLAIISCLLLGLIFSYMGVTKKGNVIVIGLAINMFVSAFSGFVLKIMGTSNIVLNNYSVSDMKINIPIIEKIPIVGDLLSGHPFITYLTILLVALMWVIMYKTKFGIYVRVVGENEDAAKSLGIKTDLYKYIAILIGSLTCVLAGINLSFESMALYTNNMTAGRGFIAIAAIYCGQGNPLSSALYAIIFGLARALSVNLSIYAGPAAGLFDVIPYLMMVVVLSVVSVLKQKNNKLRGF
ncbi:MAG: ABC transporter permease [Pleomorphochaeta sp.]